MQDLKIAFLQWNILWHDAAGNREIIDTMLKDLQPDTDLIVLPEMFSSGFSMHPGECFETMSGTTVRWMQKKAESTKAVICGSLIIREEERFYNRFLWVEPTGRISWYDKRHLFRITGEQKCYTAGFEKRVEKLKDWKISPFICYDLRFPVWSRNSDLSYDLAIYVANWPAGRQRVWEILLTARAIENQAYVVGVNRIGVDGNGTSYVGGSMLINPRGEVEVQAEKQAGLFTCRLSAEKLIDLREKFPVWKDADRFMLEE